jgi:hypothetical protein
MTACTKQTSMARPWRHGEKGGGGNVAVRSDTREKTKGLGLTSLVSLRVCWGALLRKGEEPTQALASGSGWRVRAVVVLRCLREARKGQKTAHARW